MTNSRKTKPPKHLMTRKGTRLRRIRAEAIPACSCPECGTWLFRASSGWVCPAGQHTKIVSDAILLERIASLIDSKLRDRLAKTAFDLLTWYTRRPDLAPRSVQGSGG